MMMPRKKRRLMIITSVVLIVIIIVAIFVALYITTDFLKSNSTLFTKYIGQNFSNIEKIFKNVSKNEYNELLEENKYTNTAEVKVNFTENTSTTSEGEQNPINQLSLKINGQNDKINNYNYQDINLMKNDEKISEIEYVQANNMIGIHFSDLFKQYVTANNENLKELFKNLGYSEEQLANIPDNIEFNNDIYSLFEFTQEELESIKTKYINILTKGLSNSNFSKRGNQTVEINEKNIKANAYIITLTKEQLNNIYINILEELKEDEVILSKIDKLQEFINQYKMITGEITNIRSQFEKKIETLIDDIVQTNIGEDECKVIVYESQGLTVKNVIQGVGYEINIDLLSSENTEKYIKISYKDTENEEEELFKCKKIDGQLDISYQEITNQNTSEYSINIKEDIQGNDCKRNTMFKYEDNKNKVELTIDNSIQIVENLENKITLDDDTSINLSKLEAEQAKGILDKVYTGVNEKSNEIQTTVISTEDINKILIAAKLMVEGQSIESEGITKTEINRFNSKFEILQGEDLANTDVLNIIDAIKDNLIGVDVLSDTKLRLNIDRNSKNEEIVVTLNEFIEKNTSRRYSATVEYDEETQLVKDILLEIVEKN